MNEDSLPKMGMLSATPHPALSPSDGERVASGRGRGIFNVAGRVEELDIPTRCAWTQSSRPMEKRRLCA